MNRTLETPTDLGVAPSEGAASFRLGGFGATDSGKLRRHNEDAFLSDESRGVFLVADGVGGLARGEVASQQVVDSVAAAVSNSRSVVDGLLHAHRCLVENGEVPGNGVMGSTAVAVSMPVGQTEAGIVWIGDSRAYLWRDGQLKQLTRDHSFVQSLVDMGLISEAEALDHPNRNVVMQALGAAQDQPPQIDEIKVRLQAGDRLLLCSDGLSSYLPLERVVSILEKARDDRTIVEQLIRCTLDESEAGDNVTVICISVHDAAKGATG